MIKRILVALVLILSIHSFSFGSECSFFMRIIGRCTANATDTKPSQESIKTQSPCQEIIGDWHTVIDGKLVCADLNEDCVLSLGWCDGKKVAELQLDVNGSAIEVEGLKGWIGDNLMLIDKYIFIRPR